MTRLARFATDTSGAALVEFALVCSLFFLVLFAVIDFGRLGFAHVSGETAMRIAARTAVVRPAACTGVPDRIGRSAATITPLPRFGTSCGDPAGPCQAVATVTCRGTATNPTAQEIFARIQPLLPNGAAIDSLQFTYAQDTQLGYLGGPYVPVVTVELVDRTASGRAPMAFSFLSPFTIAFNPFSLPRFSVSLPAEDLAAGDAG